MLRGLEPFSSHPGASRGVEILCAGWPLTRVDHVAFDSFDKLPRHHTAGMNQIKEHIQSISSSIAQATELLELLHSRLEEREYEMHFGDSRVVISTPDPVYAGQEFEFGNELYSVTRIIRRIEPEGGPEAAPLVILTVAVAPGHPVRASGGHLLM